MIFKDNGNWTATVSGTVNDGQAGSYAITFGGHGWITCLYADGPYEWHVTPNDQQCQQHDIHSGDGREFCGNDDRVTGAFANGDGHAAQWRDI